MSSRIGHVVGHGAVIPTIGATETAAHEAAPSARQFTLPDFPTVGHRAQRQIDPCVHICALQTAQILAGGFCTAVTGGGNEAWVDIFDDTVQVGNDHGDWALFDGLGKLAEFRSAPLYQLLGSTPTLA